MLANLNEVHDYVQQIVEAINTFLGIEVYVLDSSRRFLTGTGLRGQNGEAQYCETTLAEWVMKNEQPCIVYNPGQEQSCSGCQSYGKCPNHLAMAFPLAEGKDVLGVLCLLAIDKNQKDRAIRNQERLTQLIETMSKFLFTAIRERQVQSELHLALSHYDNVINSITEGILVIDENGAIQHLNKLAASLIGIDMQDIVGVNISNIFPELNCQDVLTRHIDKTETQVTYRMKGRLKNPKKDNFHAILMPLLSGDGQRVTGATISLRNLDEVSIYVTKTLGGYSRYCFDDIQGQNESVRIVKDKLRKAALTDSTVLIRGESGTGKELFAQAVHTASHRSKQPFVAINCSAIPESLIESELFGYEEGAFTGAKRGGKPGKFELASGGTLFLDEIGDMPLHLQSKLLRVLENRSIERVGGIEQIPIDVRIIAATNRDLEEMVKRHEFRGDLFYRLNVIPASIPPLRERKDDILLLVGYFIKRYCNIMGIEPQEFHSTTLNRIMGYSWPGNVRELQNAVEYALNMCEKGQPIMAAHLPRVVRMYTIPSSSTDSEELGQSVNSKLKTLEIKIIQEALEKFGGSTDGKEKAARYLGISLSTLYRRLREIS